MPFAKFQFKAGIDREGTNYTNAGGWFDASLVRFRKGFVEKIGGWTKQNATAFLGKADTLHMYYKTNLNNIRRGGGTEFVYQRVIAKPRAGDLYIWPAGWTHMHRGVNAPKEVKYILTGWFVYCE